MIKWAGWIYVVLGTGHTVLSLILTVPRHAGVWFSGGLWPRFLEGIREMGPAMAGYWLSLGSFGLPLLLLGFTVLWMDRRGIVPPTFVGWALLAWITVDTIILLPSPWILGVLASVLYLVGVHRARRDAAAPRAVLTP